MIGNFNSKVDEMVKEAKTKSNMEEKVKSVHEYIVKVKYTKQVDQSNTDDIRNYLYSSYGALVNQKSVCEGYVTAFQIAMNQLNIPSVRIPGNALEEKSESQSHTWNVVKNNGIWYLVNCIYDSTNDTNNWLLVSQEKTAYTHFPDGKLDSCGVNFHLPPTPFPNMVNWKIEVVPHQIGEFTLQVSYLGKNSTSLLKEL